MKVHRPEASIGEKSNSYPEVHGDFLDQEQLDLDSMGYPKLPSSMLGGHWCDVKTMTASKVFMSATLFR